MKLNACRRWFAGITVVLGVVAAVATCSEDQKVKGDDDDSVGAHGGTGGGQTTTGGNGGAGGGQSVPGGPVVITLISTPPSITEYDAATFTATVTDPDGLTDIVGGMLTSADGALTYGPFAQISGGTYTIALVWSQIDQIEAIAFQADTVRTFRATFTDTTQKTGSKTVDLTLTCNGYPACGGHCATAQAPDLCNPGCVSCNERLNQGPGEVCPGPATTAWDALTVCVCNPCLAQCPPAECPNGTGSDTNACANCEMGAIGSCPSELDDCMNN
jgi:hypothetical protein